MYNYALDTSLLPEVWTTWENKDGRVYMEGKTGKRQTHKAPWMGGVSWTRNENGTDLGCYWSTQKKPKIWVRSNSNLIYAYAKYHADIQRIELAAVTYDTTRGEYVHEWKFAGDRLFIGKDKSCLLIDGKEYDGRRITVFKYNHVWDVRSMLLLLTRLHWNDEFVKEFRKFIGADYFTIGNGATVNVNDSWSVQRWYQTVQKPRSTGKAQKLTDKLTEITLCDIDGFGEKYPVKKSGSSNYYDMEDIIYFEKINDEWCVLRSLYRDRDNSLDERWRVYIGSDGTTRIISKNQNGWVPSKQIRCSHWGVHYAYIVNKDEAMAKCPRIKYILSATNIQDEYKIVDFLITSLRFPEIEQLCKLNCHKSAQRIAQSNTPKADLKELFGGYYNDKEKSLLRKIGMTKPQLDVYMRHNGEYTDKNYGYHDYVYALTELRRMFGNDLTYLDVNSFEKYLIACKEWRRFKHWSDSYIFDDLNLDVTRFFKNLVRLMNKNSAIFTIVCDAINAYNWINASRRFNVNWYFDDVSDAVRVHDALIELQRLEQEERRALWNMQEAERRKKEEEKRKKLDKERQVYEYEDDQFIIRLPKDATEIVTEGSTQHICIGGYVSRHSMGDTNLFFLRRKSEPDKPFYAIEMDNSQNIVQIHGFGNRWLGNNPEAIPTVIRWLRKHGVKCSNEILTCKATGYGMSREFVQMPVID